MDEAKLNKIVTKFSIVLYQMNELGEMLNELIKESKAIDKP